MSSARPRVFMMDLWATVPYYTAYLSKALLAEGVDVMVGSITYYLDVDCFSSRGINLDPGLLDVVGKFQLSRLPRRAFKLLEAIVNLFALTLRFLASPPEIIHVQFLPMLKWHLPLDLWFVEFCQKHGSKIVLTVHDLLPHNTGETFKQTFVELYQMTDRIICHSDHIRMRLVTEFSVPQVKISVIPHGPFFYDLSATPATELMQRGGVESEKVRVLWQGIISPYKGVDLLLSAWKQVEAHGCNCSLIVAGTGVPDLLEQIREQVKNLGLERVELQLRFVPTRDLVALYQAVDVVAYPYRAITTSGALATGLALGKAIVASDLPVFRELLTDRENALLVDPQNAAQLAGALIELVQDASLRERLARKVCAMNFGNASWRFIAEETEKAYQITLNS